MNGAEVKVYSLAKNGADKVSDHFRVREFACQDGSDAIFISPTLVDVLEKIRKHFGVPVTVNSGYRSGPHNKKVGGSATSQHQYGLAADIVAAGVDPKKVYDYACALLPHSGGVGIYSWGVHVDVRKEKSRWNG